MLVSLVEQADGRAVGGLEVMEECSEAETMKDAPCSQLVGQPMLS